MGKSTVIPFGPQHPVLPEPIHLDLELQDEKVVRAVPLSVMYTAGWKSLWNFVTSSSMSMWRNGSAGFVLSAMDGDTAAPWKK